MASGDTDLVCDGGHYDETPNLDRLAAHGMKLTSHPPDHDDCQNCTPIRVVLMSGLYGSGTDVDTVGGYDRFDCSKRRLRPIDSVTCSFGVAVLQHLQLSISDDVAANVCGQFAFRKSIIRADVPMLFAEIQNTKRV